MISYKKFQFNWVITIIVLIFIGFGTHAYIYQWGENKMDIGGYILYLIIFCGVLFTLYGTTLIVTEKQIKIKFGIGIVIKRIELSSIISIKSIELFKFKYSIFTGGVKIIPNGTLYHVNGRHAIELKLKSKKDLIQIATKDWENFKLVIEENIRNNKKLT